jgi:hypothetical protein
MDSATKTYLPCSQIGQLVFGPDQCFAGSSVENSRFRLAGLAFSSMAKSQRTMVMTTGHFSAAAVRAE